MCFDLLYCIILYIFSSRLFICIYVSGIALLAFARIGACFCNIDDMYHIFSFCACGFGKNHHPRLRFLPWNIFDSGYVLMYCFSTSSHQAKWLSFRALIVVGIYFICHGVVPDVLANNSIFSLVSIFCSHCKQRVMYGSMSLYCTIGTCF
jgi:hypothetical protein